MENIEESGTIVRMSSNTAQVMIPGKTDCGGCHSCLRSKDGLGMIAEVPKVQGLEIGDEVKVEGRRLSQVKGGFLIYILPLLLLFSGYLLGESVAVSMGYESGQTAGLITALLLFCLPFLVIYLVGVKRKRAGEYALHITRVILKGK